MLLFKQKKVHVPNFDEVLMEKDNTLQKIYNMTNNINFSILSNYTAQVIFAIDYTYSMEYNYRRGKVNKLLETLLPLGLKLGNGLFVDVILFNRDFYKMPSLRMSNCQNYIKRYLPNYHKFHMGGTEYSPILGELLHTHDKNSKIFPDNITYVIFLTDNECSAYDIRKTYDIMQKINTENIFLQFAKTGDNALNTLHRLENDFFNTSLLDKNIMGNITEEEIYEELLTRYINWLKSI